jgi:KUP system potassium uptake protein
MIIMANAESAGHTAPQKSEQGSHSTQGLGVLTLGALGVVYGDIGTSPIYAFREALHAASGGAAVADARIFWAFCR